MIVEIVLKPLDSERNVSLAVQVANWISEVEVVVEVAEVRGSRQLKRFNDCCKTVNQRYHAWSSSHSI